MNAMRAIIPKQCCRFARRTGVALALCGWLAWAALPAAAITITNVTVVNVTPASFSVFWRTAGSTPSISVFADAGGLTNLAGQVGIEPFPLHTGNPDLAAGFDRRLGRAALQQKTRGYGLVQMRVTGCRPNTTYYFRLTSTPAAGSPEVFPASGPLPAVTTPAENTFVVNHQQLIIDVPGLDIEGRVVQLTHTNALHPLAAVIGDGVGTNQVLFDVNDLFDLGNGGNFSRLGAQDFAVDVLGPNQSDLPAHFTLNFAAVFTVVQTTSASVGNQFLAVFVGSAVLRTGDTGSIPITIQATRGVTNLSFILDLATNRFENLGLQATAAGITSASIINLAPGRYKLILLATDLPSGDVASLVFTAGSNQISGIIRLPPQSVSALQNDGTQITNLVAQPGRVVIVAEQPVLEGELAPDGTRSLMVYGKVGSSYVVESSSTLSSSSWALMGRFPMTNISLRVAGLAASSSPAFYRSYELLANPPILEPHLDASGNFSLILYGRPGTTNTLQYATDLFGVTTWLPLLDLNFTNSYRFVNGLAATNRVIFYRLQSR